jgi:perosamine synthetase
MHIPISKPYFGPEEQQAVLEPLTTGWVVQGPKVAEFERRFAAFTGSRYAVATTSCTTALELALTALGVGPGVDVLLPAFTWIATANVVEHRGARPIFVDIRLDTYTIDVEQLLSRRTPHTRAVIPVSLFGLSADMQPILELARRWEWKVIEDAACAFGAWYQGRHAGTLADAACFSFHPRKAITTGEGGMLLTQRPEVAEAVRCLRDHGAAISDLARHQQRRSYLLPAFERAGHNYRMTDLQGALGVAQMQRAEWLLARRAALAQRYDAALAPLGWLRPPQTPPGYRHGYQAYVCLFQPEPPRQHNVARLHALRNQLMDRLEAAGIATRPGTHAVHLLGYYRRKYDLRPEDCLNSYIADQLTITLPLYPQMTEEEQDYVITQLKRWGPGT